MAAYHFSFQGQGLQSTWVRIIEYLAQRVSSWPHFGFNKGYLLPACDSPYYSKLSSFSSFAKFSFQLVNRMNIDDINIELYK